MLRTRITLATVAVVAAAIVGAMMLTYRAVAPLVVDQLERGMSDRADTVLALVAANAPVPERADTTEQVLLPDGTVTHLTPGRKPLPVNDTDRAIARAGSGEAETEVAQDGAELAVLTKGRPGGGAVMVAQHHSEALRVEQLDSEVRTRTMWITAAALAVAALLCWLAIGGILRPIRRLAATTARIADTQDLSTTLPDRHRGEVGDLTRNFNTMLAALRVSRAQQQRLAQDAAHELRTPLTSVRGSAELLQRAAGRLSPEDEAKVLTTLVHEARALDDLVRELVDLASDQYATEDPIPLQLADLAEDCAARCRRRTARLITVTSASPATVQARTRALSRAIDNLLDNATKYSPPDTPVTVEVSGPRLTVRDQGPGIPAADRPAIFDRFYRADATRSTPGSGLGLAIVHDVIAAHGGAVHAAPNPGGGAAVGFTLPTPRRGSGPAL
ncbi:HAMP domain-containing sensor histidine kinase [Nocardia huaxiensis]|uniref:HAMP domain-containing sensor histidine kinase n=1 Tax=Nocardia huaxiensis TaxID=2755382 RepID=UPI001E4FC20F|nr:HAMP domain-containing sensor histidine kinase [Nocardia huaxiensis]UFS99548.1 HAMP domain-containing histidine kinase [Nocardia huaxiensis]